MNNYGYDKLLTKDEFYMEVIYPNLVKSAGIYFYNEDFKTARRAGNTIEDVINTTFFYTYKPLVKGGKWGEAGKTIYDYYVKNFFDVKEGKYEWRDFAVKGEDGKVLKDENGKTVKEPKWVPVQPCLNYIRQYMNTFTRNVLVDMCKVAENKKSVVSLETPIGDEEGRTFMDVIADMEDDSVAVDSSLAALHYSIDGEVLFNDRGAEIKVLDIVLALENGCSIKEVCDEFRLTNYDVLNFFNEKSSLFKDCFTSVTDASLDKLNRRTKNAKRGLNKSKAEDVYEPPLPTVEEMLGSNG